MSGKRGKTIKPEIRHMIVIADNNETNWSVAKRLKISPTTVGNVRRQVRLQQQALANSIKPIDSNLVSIRLKDIASALVKTQRASQNVWDVVIEDIQSVIVDLETKIADMQKLIDENRQLVAMLSKYRKERFADAVS